MRRFWRRGGGFSELERRLRAERPKPRADFARSLEGRLRHDRRTRPQRRLGLGVAVGLTGAILVSLALLGPLAYAASTMGNVVHSAVHAVSAPTTPAKPLGTDRASFASATSVTEASPKTSAAAQYKPPHPPKPPKPPHPPKPPKPPHPPHK